MTTATRTLTAALSGILLLASAAQARADQKQECSAAYDATQSLRDEGKLLDARKQALACSNPLCAAFVREDCSQWLSEIDALVPTVVFTAKDAAGADTLAVRVILDGRVLLERLDGSAVLVDPGEHHVRFEIAAMGALEKDIVVQKGEKNRAIDASFDSRLNRPSPSSVKPDPEPEPKPSPPVARPVVPILAAPVVAPVPEPITPRKSETPSKSTIPTWAWISGGTGLGLGLLGAVFGIASWSANETAVKLCGGDVKLCSKHDAVKADPFVKTRDDERRVFIALTTVGGMGVLSGILGIFTAKSSPANAPKTFSLTPVVSPDGGGLFARGEF